MKKCICYLEENKCYGRDSKGKNKILYAFTPLKILDVGAGAIMAIVKPSGRGNYNKYLVRVEELTFKAI